LQSWTQQPTPNSKTEVAEPTPEQLVERINQQYLAIVTDEGRSNRTIVDRAIRVGKDLLDLKSKKGEIPHGDWKKWVPSSIQCQEGSTLDEPRKE
jgi:hypothetical protein